MPFYPCREYPAYTHQIVVDTTSCAHAKRQNGWARICNRDGSRRTHKSCKKCRYFKPTLKARIKAATDVLFWKNVGKYR